MFIAHHHVALLITRFMQAMYTGGLNYILRDMCRGTHNMQCIWWINTFERRIVIITMHRKIFEFNVFIVWDTFF